MSGSAGKPRTGRDATHDALRPASAGVTRVFRAVHHPDDVALARSHLDHDLGHAGDHAHAKVVGPELVGVLPALVPAAQIDGLSQNEPEPTLPVELLLEHLPDRLTGSDVGVAA